MWQRPEEKCKERAGLVLKVVRENVKERGRDSCLKLLEDSESSLCSSPWPVKAGRKRREESNLLLYVQYITIFPKIFLVPMNETLLVNKLCRCNQVQLKLLGCAVNKYDCCS